MTVTVQSTSNTNTMAFWLARTNELANAMSTVAVTANSTAAVGNAAVTGSFIANSVYANTLVVANTTSNVTISVPNTVIKASGDYYLNANGSWSPIITPVISGTYQTAGTSAQEIDSYEITAYNAAEYYIHVEDMALNASYATKLMTIPNGVNAFATEYATVASNTIQGVFGVLTVSSNTTHLKVLLTPSVANTLVSFSRVNF